MYHQECQKCQSLAGNFAAKLMFEIDILIFDSLVGELFLTRWTLLSEFGDIRS